MQKILSYFILIILFLNNLSFINQAKAQEDNYFIITAYYSPLPDQKFYLKGNYEDEKKLNGEGVKGASGKNVFIGMLAAPKNYSFGTKIELEGLGVGEVSDRGGAIVQAGNRGYEYDRIDVWMGYGDEGLKRALNWGKRKVKGNIIDKNTTTNLDYTKTSGTKVISQKVEIQKTETIDTKTSEKIMKQETKRDIKIISIFDSANLNTEQIKELSYKLKELSIYTGKETSNYKDLVSVIANYQVKKGLIKDYNDIAAGYFGPKTRASLKSDFENLVKQKEQKAKQELEEKNKILVLEREIQNLKILADKESSNKISSIGYPKYGQISHEVRKLQIVLKELGSFKEKDTAIFGEKTKQAIYSYQVSKGLVSKTDDLGAGMIGPRTAASMQADLAKIYFTNKTKDKQYADIKTNAKQIISDSMEIKSL